MFQQTATKELTMTTDASASGGMAIGTPVLTLEGELPVEFLSVGDRVLTRNGARKIRAITVMVVQSASVVVVAKRALGHDRPDADLVLSANQMVLIRDWRAKALFGADKAVVPVSRLVDGDYIRAEQTQQQRLFVLSFDQEEVIYASGVELSCAPMPALAAV